MSNSLTNLAAKAAEYSEIITALNSIAMCNTKAKEMYDQAVSSFTDIADIAHKFFGPEAFLAELDRVEAERNAQNS